MPTSRPEKNTNTIGVSCKKKPADLLTKRLSQRCIIILSLIAILTVLSQVIVPSLMTNHEQDSRVIGIARNQGVLSQKIAKTAMYLKQSNSAINANFYRETLSETLAQFQRTHHSLEKSDIKLGLAEESSAEMLALFKKINPHYRNLVSSSESLLASAIGTDSAMKAIRLIKQSEPDYSVKIKAIAVQFEHESHNRNSQAHWLSLGLMGLTLLVLFSGAFLVSSPATRRIQSDIRKLADREEDLENLFAASPTALLMIDTQTLSILRGNQQLQELTKLPPTQLEGMKLHQLLDASYDTNRIFIDKLQRDKALNEFEVVLLDTSQAVIESLVSSRTLQFAKQPVIVLGFTNINQIKKAQRKLEYYATYDELTGLMNRRTGLAFLEKAMARSWRESSDLSVIYADLDGLKKANDRYGHAEGDRLIRAAANIMTGLIRMSDCAIRLGGDEFLMILPNCSPKIAQRIADNLERLLMSLKADDNGKKVLYSISCGITNYVPDRHASPEDLITEADQVMYQIKQSRK